MSDTSITSGIMSLRGEHLASDPDNNELSSCSRQPSRHSVRPGDRVGHEGPLDASQPPLSYETPPSYERIGPFTTALALTGVSVVLCCLELTETSFSADSTVYQMSVSSRTNVQVGAAVLATIFSACWAYSACSTFALVTGAKLVKKSATLGRIQMYAAVAMRSPDWSLPPLKLIICISACMLALAPAWFWTGALTPQKSVRLVTGVIPCAKTGVDSYQLLRSGDPNPWWMKCWATTRPNGTFSNCPGLYLSSRLVDTASSALSTMDGVIVHPKPDNSGMSYTGRSYGVGSSVGLVVSSVSEVKQPQAYLYEENGYHTHASCAYNQSAAWGFSEDTVREDAPAHVFYAQGVLPNANGVGPDYYAQFDLNNTQNTIVSIIAAGSRNWPSSNGPYMLALAAGSHYVQLDKVQCDIEFTPTRFAVNASLIEKTITVSPTNKTIGDADVDPTGRLKLEVLGALQSISLVQTTLYTSTLGDALMRNAAILVNGTAVSLRTQGNTDNSTLPISPEEMLRAVETSVNAMLEDALGLFQAAALTQDGDWSTQELKVQIPVVKIGSPVWIYCVTGTNGLTLLIVMFFTVTQRLFIKSPKFDFQDGSVLAIAVHNGALGGGLGTCGQVSKSNIFTDKDAHKIVATLDLEHGSGGKQPTLWLSRTR